MLTNQENMLTKQGNILTKQENILTKKIYLPQFSLNIFMEISFSWKHSYPQYRKLIWEILGQVINMKWMKFSGREDEIFNMYDKTIMFLMTQINQNISHETNVDLNVDDKQQQQTSRLNIFNCTIQR